jgi:hypothetical protein
LSVLGLSRGRIFVGNKGKFTLFVVLLTFYDYIQISQILITKNEINKKIQKIPPKKRLRIINSSVYGLIVFS